MFDDILKYFKHEVETNDFSKCFHKPAEINFEALENQ